MTRLQSRKQKPWPQFRTLLFLGLIIFLLAGRSIAQGAADDNPPDNGGAILPVPAESKPEDDGGVPQTVPDDNEEDGGNDVQPPKQPPAQPADQPPAQSADQPPAAQPPAQTADQPPAQPAAPTADQPPAQTADHPPAQQPSQALPANDNQGDEDGDDNPDDHPDDSGDDPQDSNDEDDDENNDEDGEKDEDDGDDDDDDDEGGGGKGKDPLKAHGPKRLPLKTEPTFWHTVFNISIADYERMKPGHLFLSPTSPKGTPGWQGYGPQIYDVYGNLIWYGNHTTSNRCMRLHPCDYLGEKGNHLCFHDGRLITVAFNLGVIRFLDNSYQEIFVSEAQNGLAGPDIHEINTPRGTNGEILLQDVYNVTKLPVKLPDGGENTRWTANICFQEIEIRTKKVNFQWCAYDHMPMMKKGYEPKENETFYPIVVWGGRGNQQEPWDFWHINGIDRNSEGDYFISLRHQSSIVKIAGNSGRNGKPGDIIWILKNGQPSSFKKDFTFSFQHAVRVLSTGPEKEWISFMDNGSAGTSPYSFGKIIELNNKTMEATIVRKFPEPEKRRGNTAGNMQPFYEAGGALMGWGSRPYFSEYTDDGTCVYHARISTGHSPQVWKYPWKGYPKQKPKVVSYKMDCSEDTAVHVYSSWNGATEVDSWRVYVAPAEHGPWDEAGDFKKQGFETNATLTDIPFPVWVYTEAMDVDGKVLSKTDPVRTFVPNATTEHCDETGCDYYHEYPYLQEWSTADQCPHAISWRDMPLFIQIPVIVGFLCAVQWFVWMWEAFFAPGFAGFGYFARNERGEYVSISDEGYKDADDPETPVNSYANGGYDQYGNGYATGDASEKA